MKGDVDKTLALTVERIVWLERWEEEEELSFPFFEAVGSVGSVRKEEGIDARGRRLKEERRFGIYLDASKLTCLILRVE